MTPSPSFPISGISARYSLIGHAFTILPLRKLANAIHRDLLSFKKYKEKSAEENVVFFLIFAQNIDYGYTIEPPRRAKIRNNTFFSADFFPCIPQFCYIKVEFKGVYITRTCFRDALTG